ncbi:hypothetical protein HOI83_04720 [Candidatus Uhrbacteria bacterium]|jgi:hypothetical protein|nr:hypothetical protein [Candidatus Uhrbacteria bacterium]
MKAWQNYKRFFKVAIAGLSVLILVFAADPVSANFVTEGLADGLAASGNVILNLLARVILVVANFLGTMILVLLELILLPIVQYSDFIGHPVVLNGWSIVRDLVNTGFIVLMLVIAFGTMFGIQRINWTQQIPRLVVAAIAINFSRLITGLLIDIGQVVMIGFVNALQQVGVGNFLQLLKLSDLQTQVDGSLTIDGASNLGSAMMAAVMSAIVLVVIATLAGVLVYRIVVLWVLIILSPAAFLAGAAQGILSKAGDMYSQWWGKLTAAIMIGPILTFFLWLALASVSGMTQGFDTNRNPPPSGAVINNSIVTNDNFTGFIIGIALLLAGLEMAVSTAGSLGGAAQSIAGAGLSAGKKIAGAPIALAGAGAMAVGRKGVQKGRAAGAAVAGGVSSLYRGRTQERRLAAREKQKKRAEQNIAAGGVRGMFGRGQLAKVAEEERKENSIQGDLAKKYAGFGSKLGDQQKLDFIEKYSGPKATEEQRAQAMALQSATVGDEGAFAGMMENPSTKARAMKMLADVQKHQKDTDDDKGQDKIKKMLASNPQWENTDAASMQKALEGMTQQERAGIDKRAWGSSHFRQAARDSGVYDEMFDTDKETRNSARKGAKKDFIDAAQKHINATPDVKRRDKQEQDRYQDAVDGQRGLDMNLAANKDGANSDAAIHGLVNANISGTMGSIIGGGMPMGDIDMPELIRKSMSGGAGAGAAGDTVNEVRRAIVSALKEKGSAQMIQALEQTATSGNKEEKARANQMLREVESAIHSADAAAGGTDTSINKAARTVMTRNPDSSYNYDSSGTAMRNEFASPKDARVFAGDFAKNPTMIVNLSAEMENMSGDMAAVAAESLTPKSLDAMLASMNQAKGSPNEETWKSTIKASEKLLKNYRAELKRSGGSKAMIKQLDGSIRHMKRRVVAQAEV